MRRFLKMTAIVAPFTLMAAVSADEGVAFEDVVYLTCEEATSLADGSTEKAVEIVSVLARFSLEKRELVVPEDRGDLSDEFGELIKAHCTTHPDDLLYNAVDRSIRRLL